MCQKKKSIQTKYILKNVRGKENFVLFSAQANRGTPQMLHFSKSIKEQHLEMSKTKIFLSYWGSCALPSAEKLAYLQFIIVKKRKKTKHPGSYFILEHGGGAHIIKLEMRNHIEFMLCHRTCGFLFFLGFCFLLFQRSIQTFNSQTFPPVLVCTMELLLLWKSSEFILKTQW